MPVSFLGTRSTEQASFGDAVLTGSPTAGGLFYPDHIPSIDVRGASTMTETADRLLLPWIEPVVNARDLHEINRIAFSFALPITTLKGGAYSGIRICELFHGPTGSFKDFGARWLAGIVDLLLVESGERRRVIVATSGDTGSAVADAFSGRKQIDVVLLFPSDGISDIQKNQLTQVRPGVKVFAVNGTFDDCQRLAKAGLTRTVSGPKTTSANSINIGRLLPQMTYYLMATNHDHASGTTFVVPSGNLGNLTAGILASLTSGREWSFIAAHNINDSMVRYFRGESVPQASRKTISNAMDVGDPSNLDRLKHILSASEISQKVVASSAADVETMEEMRKISDVTGYLADPHTAVAVRAARLSRVSSNKLIVLSTADPAKFSDVVREATGRTPTQSEALLRSTLGEKDCEMIDVSGHKFFEYLDSDPVQT